MRRDISFNSQGARLAGWLYLPDALAPGSKVPGIVMATAIGFVKEMYMPSYAERFAAAGFAAIAFDYRNSGDSAGEPREQIFPHEQQEDIRNAINFLSEQPEVDADKIGVWGVSYGGGHVLQVAAYDRRVKAVVSTVPAISTYDALMQVMGPQGVTGFLGYLQQDHFARYKTGDVHFMAVVSNDGSPALAPNPKAYEFYAGTAKAMAPNWRNQITMESIEQSVQYRPAAHIQSISPTPLLMIVAEQDEYCPANLATAAFEQARDPKKLIVLPCGHADVYTEPWISKSAGAAIDWFKQNLSGSSSTAAETQGAQPQPAS